MLGVEGITDPSDAQRLEQSLAQMESVRSVSVNYGSLQVSVQYNSALVSLADIRKK
jgi:Cu+-exporting ATPase